MGLAPLLWRGWPALAATRGTIGRGEPCQALAAARDAIRRGELGEVAFCRVFARDGTSAARLLEAARFALDEGPPRAVRVEGRFATLRYPRRIICSESGARCNTISFLGARATLRMEPL